MEKMLATQNHRGPDDSGVVSFSNDDYFPVLRNNSNSSLPYLQHKEINNANIEAVLGHNRLSIIDLSELGHQPMSDENGRYWITFNGEIYNYIEIKERLKGFGYTFFSNSDTEVILKAFIHFGKDCVNEFNGMWAFAIYDRLTKELFCSRDRVGVKPFYYLSNDDYFAFASEMKPLLLLLEGKPSLNLKEFNSFFVNGRIGYSTDTLFNEIQELAPSYNLVFNQKSTEFHLDRYYQVKAGDCISFTKNQDVEADALELGKIIEDGIKLRLRSDVEVGACLSGGLDSSSIVAMSHKVGGSGLKTFTAVQPGMPFDEWKWAQIVNVAYNCDWHKTQTDKAGLVTHFEDLVLTHEYPLVSLSTYAQYQVMAEVQKNGVKVVLDGQGADEMFAGYPHHRSILLMDLLTSGKFKMMNSLAVSSSEGFENSRVLKDILKRSIGPKFPYFFNPILKSKTLELDYLNKDFVALKANASQNTFVEILLEDYYGGYLKNLLRYEDRNAMRFGVESRTLFSDDINLMNWFKSTPKQNFFKEGYSKYILRKAIKNLPNQIVWRKDKVGYQVPNNEWMWDLAKANEHLIEQLPTELFNVNKIKADFQKLFNRKFENENFRILKFISFAKWYDLFIK